MAFGLRVFENNHPGGMSIRQREFLLTVGGKQRWEAGTLAVNYSPQLAPTS